MRNAYVTERDIARNLPARKATKDRMKTEAKETYRFQLLLDETARKRIDFLMSKTNASTQADVFRDALKLYDALLREIDNGGKLYVKNENGEANRIELLF